MLFMYKLSVMSLKKYFVALNLSIKIVIYGQQRQAP